MNIVLLATGKLPRSYFDTVRADLGDRAELELDVIGWSPPREPLEDAVRTFLLLGPGRMPVAAPPAAVVPAPAPDAPAPAPPAAAAAAPAAPAAPAAAPAAPTVAPGIRPKPPLGPKRVVKGVLRRIPLIPRKIKTSKPGRKVQRLITGDIPRQYWNRLKSRQDAQSLVDRADLVIALDNRSVNAGWHLARRPGATTVVLGIPAAARELAERDLHGRRA